MDRGRIFMVDQVKRKQHEIFSVPWQNIETISLSPDNLRIYFSLSSSEGDLWLAMLE